MKTKRLLFIGILLASCSIIPTRQAYLPDVIPVGPKVTELKAVSASKQAKKQYRTAFTERDLYAARLHRLVHTEKRIVPDKFDVDSIIGPITLDEVVIQKKQKNVYLQIVDEKGNAIYTKRIK